MKGILLVTVILILLSMSILNIIQRSYDREDIIKMSEKIEVLEQRINVLFMED